MPPTKHQVTPAVRNLRTSALIVSVLALAQGALGGTVLGGGDGIRTIHGYIGYATFVVALVTAFFAWKASQETNRKGSFFHALALPVLALVQIGLAEMDLKWVHVIVGVLFLIAAFGLYAMADRPTSHETV
jgi:heme A synthase